jgi:uncharacterized protein involved in exopolysaccharide biosynthesis
VSATLAALGAVFALMGGAYVRLFRHEERIRSLEDHHANKVKAIADLSERMDANHEATRARIDAVANEIRADLRIIMQRCISLTPKDHP